MKYKVSTICENDYESYIILNSFDEVKKYVKYMFTKAVCIHLKEISVCEQDRFGTFQFIIVCFPSIICECLEEYENKTEGDKYKMLLAQTDIDRIKWSINQLEYEYDRAFLRLQIDKNPIATVQLFRIKNKMHCANIIFHDSIYSKIEEFKNLIYNYFGYKQDKDKEDYVKTIELNKYTFDIGITCIINDMNFIWELMFIIKHIDSMYECYKIDFDKEFVVFQWKDQEYTKPITNRIKRRYSMSVTHDKCQLHLRVKLYQTGKEIDEYETILVNMNDFILIEKDPINPEKQIIVMYTEEEFKKLFGKVKLCQN